MTIIATHLHKSFGNQKETIDVLEDISFRAEAGESIAIMGASGEGKSTLLHILGALETPSSGALSICGQIPNSHNAATIRNKHIGFVFQAYHLLEDFSVLENVMMPIRISNQKSKLFIQKAKKLLHDVGLSEKQTVLAKYLSGGEKQRVAIARALINDPDCIFADEPTGNLDAHSSDVIEQLLLNTSKQYKKTLIIVTHDQAFASKCDRLLLLKERRLYNHPLCEKLP